MKVFFLFLSFPIFCLTWLFPCFVVLQLLQPLVGFANVLSAACAAHLLKVKAPYLYRQQQQPPPKKNTTTKSNSSNQRLDSKSIQVELELCSVQTQSRQNDQEPSNRFLKQTGIQAAASDRTRSKADIQTKKEQCS